MISLPSGGGSVSGLGEKFSPDLFTGTGNFSVPIALPEGRNGFQPQLTLGYSTGNGNSPYGLGWGLSVPGIMRKTSKGVPQYSDEKDVYILSGSEDLIPISESSNTVSNVTTHSTIYKPRTEGLFARITHFEAIDVTDPENPSYSDYWEVRSKDGLVSHYGNPDLERGDSDNTVIANPGDRSKIFAWKLYKTEDPFGNHILYEYLRDFEASDPSQKEMGYDQLYLDKIKYVDWDDSGTTRYLVSVQFDYGSSDRSDPFSAYTSGFQVRTKKLCEAINVYTHPESGDLPDNYSSTGYQIEDGIKTKAYLLSYENSAHNGSSLLSSVQVRGYDQDENEDELTEDMPALQFKYTGFSPAERDFSAVKGKDLPALGLSAPTMELIDLDGNGLPDIVEMNGSFVRYWSNKGGGEFHVPRLMEDAPSGLSLEDPDVQLVDADGDGRADLLSRKPGLNGYFPLDHGGKWDKEGFRPQRIAPSFSFADPEVKMMDLTGNGVTDVLRNGVSLECYFQDSDLGWDEPKMKARSGSFDFPEISFANPRVKTADMSGDGLQDLVLIHDGGLEYWPSLGYGNWGGRKVLSFSRIGYDFNPERMFLGDLDGDGVADLIYVDNNKVSIWFNKQGEGFSDPVVINGTPPVSDLDSVRVVDLLGQGTPGILWSSDGSYSTETRMYFLDLTAGVKPYVLEEMDNQMGAVTKVKYESSTIHYQRDQKIPTERWQTSLPFPVQVVSCVEVIDQISQGKLATEYRYHHGYWDGGEREFRGFGRVDQQDTETFEVYNQEGLHGSQTFESVAQTQYSPPLLTKSWFYLGPVGPEYGEWLIPDFSGEYFSEDDQAFDTQEELRGFLSVLPRRARRDAHRTLRGSSLRTELYALDGSADENRPYTVTEQHYDLRKEFQPSDYVSDENNSFPDKKNWGSAYVFFSMAAASRTTQWERGVKSENHHTFSFSNNYDSYGNLQESIVVAVPRGRDFKQSLSSAPGEAYLVTYKEKVFGYNDTAGDTYIVDRLCSEKDFEITNDGKDDLTELVETTVYDTNNQELFQHSIYYYDGTALTNINGADFGVIQDYGVLKRTKKLMISDDVITNVYGSTPVIYEETTSSAWNDYPKEAQDKIVFTDQSAGGNEGHVAGYYLDVSKRQINDNGTLKRDYLGSLFYQRYDYDDYGYKPDLDVKYQGALAGFSATSIIQTALTLNYRTLQYEQVFDPNRNYSKVLFSPLGFVKAKLFADKSTWKDTEADPAVKMEYDFFNFVNNSDPVYVKSTTREWHKNDSAEANYNENTFAKYEYSDGFGRLVQTRQQSEDVIFGETTNDRIFGDSGLNPDPDGTSDNAEGTERDSQEPLNVVVSGWQVYDNKGQVVEKYEPFFDSGFDFAEPSTNQKGKKVQMFYDPRGQVIRTLNPDNTEQRVIFGVPGTIASPDLDDLDAFEPTPWESYTYDANDLGGITHAMESADYDDHWYTPSSVVLDALGRQVKTTQRVDGISSNDIVMEYEYDIRGNVLEITDALGRTLTTNKYSEANWLIEEDHLDSGKTTFYFHYSGKPKHIVRANGSESMIFFDTLGREIYVWGKDFVEGDWTVKQFTFYGEHALATGPSQYNINMRARPYQVFDGAGLQTNVEFDYKGNPLETQRQVVEDSKLDASIPGNYEDLNEAMFSADHTALIPDDFSTSGEVKPDATELDNHVSDYMEDHDYKHIYEYDALSRPVKITLPTKETTGDGIPQHIKYNERGLVSELEFDTGEYSKANVHYNAKGQRILILSNKIMTRYAYDADTFRLKRIRAWAYEEPVGTTHEYAELNTSNWHKKLDYSYDYDLVGNILSLRDKSPDSSGVEGPGDLTREYEYDPIYRLLKATGRECSTGLTTSTPWVSANAYRCHDHTATNEYERNYTYDKMGNITQMDHDITQGTGTDFTRNYIYPTGNANNKLEKLENASSTKLADYTYDDSGNMIQENTERYFTFNSFNQMSSFYNQTSNGNEPTVYSIYLYGADGQRVKKWTRKDNDLIDVTNYIGAAFEHQYETDHSLSVDSNNDYEWFSMMLGSERLNSERYGNDDNDKAGADDYYEYINDHLGSVILTYKSDDGALYSREECFPFGENAFGGYAKKRYRFTGKERDDGSGLCYFGARYYAPWLCRFTSVDPLKGESPGLSPYHYSSNNPINRIDPTGMKDESASGPSASDNLSGGAKGAEKAGATQGNGEGVIKGTAVTGASPGGATEGVSNAPPSTSGPSKGSGETKSFSEFDFKYDTEGFIGSPDVGGESGGRTEMPEIEKIEPRKAKPFDAPGPKAPAEMPSSSWKGGTMEGLSINVVPGGGFNLELGRITDSKGNSSFYYSFGFSFGFDASIGFISKSIERTDNKTFDVSDIVGWGAEHEGSGFNVDFIFSGGDADRKEGVSKSYQKNLKYKGIGFSLGTPFGYSFQFGKTGLIR